MAELLGDIVGWMEGLPAGWIYATVFVVAYLENVVPPIPGDMVVVFGGYLVGLGRVEFVPVVVLATVAGALGFMSVYAVGRWIGDAALDPSRLRWVPKRAAWKARDWLRRWGYGVVAANRFLSGARSVISLMVGAAKMRPVPVALWATVSAAVWTSLIAYLGAVVGENWTIIGDWLARYSQAVTVVLAVGLVVYFGAKWWRRQAASRRASQRNGEDPGNGDSAGSRS
jgi:membrane protein DedA with SNARE-associated domain